MRYNTPHNTKIVKHNPGVIEDNSLNKNALRFYTAPIAQWIERLPPEQETCVRVAVGVPTKTHPEHHQIGVEQFLEMLRFDQRSKLEELPGIRK